MKTKLKFIYWLLFKSTYNIHEVNLEGCHLYTLYGKEKSTVVFDMDLDRIMRRYMGEHNDWENGNKR